MQKHFSNALVCVGVVLEDCDVSSSQNIAYLIFIKSFRCVYIYIYNYIYYIYIYIYIYIYNIMK